MPVELLGTGHSSVVYIDDTYLQGDYPEQCQNNVCDTVKSLWDLRFHIRQICTGTITEVGISWV